MLFPIVCVDDFYEDPDKIRDLALSLNYSKTEAICPGVRTDYLFNIDKNLFDKFCEKLMSLYYNFNVDSCNWTIETCFQKTERKSDDFSSILNIGWNHLDGNVLAAGVIYLNKNPILDSGTTISSLKTEKNSFDYTSRDQFYTKGLSENYEEKLKKHDSFFEDSLVIKNKYNRLIMYDSSYWHKETNFISSENEDRLTQVFFIHNLESKTYPIQRLKTINV